MNGRQLSVFVLTVSLLAACKKDRDDAGPLLAALAYQASFSRGAECGRSANAQSVHGELLLKVDGTRSSGEILRQIQQFDPGSRLLSEGSDFLRVQTSQSAALLATVPGVARAQPNYIFRVTQTLPNDPLYGQTNWPPIVHAPDVWGARSDCSNITVAVIDSGIGLAHSDLSSVLWTNAAEIAGNGLDDDGNGFIDDVHGWDFVENDAIPQDLMGHGTHVAGILGAAGNNVNGVAGVCWNSKIMALRVFGATGEGQTDSVVRALKYAREKGARIVNMSFGGSGGDTGDLLYQEIDAARLAGMLVVVAAGNAGTNNDVTPFYPAAYGLDNILTVSSTSDAGDLSSFSNYGPVSVHLSAPGEKVLSTWPFAQGTPVVESFDSISTWNADGSSWRVEEVPVNSGSACSLTDPSGLGRPYADNVNSMAYKAFRPEGVGPVRVSFKARIETEPLTDSFEVYWAPATSVMPTQLLGFATGPKFRQVGWLQYSYLLDEPGPVQLGFRLRSNGSITDEGISITDLSVYREIPDSRYSTLTGTSMATPVVAGAAALLWSADIASSGTCSYAKVKQALMNGGTAVPSLAGKTITGKLVDLAGARTEYQALGCTFP